MTSHTPILATCAMRGKRPRLRRPVVRNKPNFGNVDIGVSFCTARTYGQQQTDGPVKNKPKRSQFQRLNDRGEPPPALPPLRAMRGNRLRLQWPTVRNEPNSGNAKIRVSFCTARTYGQPQTDGPAKNKPKRSQLQRLKDRGEPPPALPPLRAMRQIRLRLRRPTVRNEPNLPRQRTLSAGAETCILSPDDCGARMKGMLP